MATTPSAPPSVSMSQVEQDVSQSLWATLGKLTQAILEQDTKDKEAGAHNVRISNRANRRCKKRAAEILLKGGRTRTSKRKSSKHVIELSAAEVLRGEAFDLRLKGKANRAARLEASAEKLESETKEEEFQGLASVVRLLMALKQSSVEQDDGDDDDFDQVESLPIFPFKSALAKAPSDGGLSAPRTIAAAPFLHGQIVETAKVRPYRYFSAKDFSPSVFTFPKTEDRSAKSNSATTTKPYSVVDRDLLRAPPGQGLIFFGQAPTKPPSLAIPKLDLLSDETGRHLRVPVPASKNEGKKKKQDEGYESPVPKSPSDDSDYDEGDVWDHVLSELHVPTRRTWESLGCREAPREKPYMMELGPEGVHLSWLAAMKNLKLIDPDLPCPKLRLLDEETLVCHLSYLMVGIASESFRYDEKEETFHFVSGIYVKGVTTDALQSFSRDFVTCGTYCRRLEKMCESKPKRERRLLGYTKPGLIYLSFLDGVAKYLQGYRTTVLKIAHKKRLLGLSASLSKLSAQIRFLGRLCKVHKDKRRTEDLPTGINLICYLFDFTLQINSRDLYFVLVAILRRTAEPYFR